MNIFLNEENIYNEGKTIKWNVYKNLNHPAKLKGTGWEIYAENDIKIKSNEYRRVALGVGYEMSKGIVCVSISSNLKFRLTLLNGLCLEQKSDNIIICLFNFSQELITIKKGVLFAYIKYLK